MARPPPSVSSRILSLDAEPRSYAGSVAPPAYRTLTNTASDTWSEYSADKKRNSWTNLVDSTENLNKYKVNHYPIMHEQPGTHTQKHKLYGSASQLGAHCPAPAPLARHNVNGSFSTMSDIVTFQGPKGPMPVFADTQILNPSYPPSEAMGAPPPMVPSYHPQPSSIDPRPPTVAPKRNRLQEWKACCARPWTRALLLLALLLALIGVILAVVLTQTLSPQRNFDMMWQAPAALRANQTASNQVSFAGDPAVDRIRIALKGAAPFKGNFISYYDFKSGKAVIIDESLTRNGQNLACFVMAIDSGNTPSYDAMIKAAARTKNVMAQESGWAESWQYSPSPLNAQATAAMFNPPIPECNTTARWIQLDRTVVDMKSKKCSECSDFCLPEFGITGGQEDGNLNVVRRDCFHLFVPEWRTYAAATTAEQNQRDFEAYYRNRNAANGDASGSRWIPLAGMNYQATASPSMVPVGFGQAFGQAAMQQMPPQQQQQPGQAPSQNFGMMQSAGQSQPYGQPSGMMNGVNGMTPNSNGMQPNPVVMGGYQNGQQQPQPNSVYGGAVAPNGMGSNYVPDSNSPIMPAIRNALGEVSSGAQNVYSGVQHVGQEAGRAIQQGVDSFGNFVGFNGQQGNAPISGVVNLPSNGRYGSGGTNTGLDFGRPQANGQATYPMGYVPGLMQSTNVEAGIPGVANSQYYSNYNNVAQTQQQQRMGDLSGYSPDLLQSAAQQQQPTNGVDGRQGVIGMAPPASTPATSGYVPDVATYGPNVMAAPGQANPLQTSGTFSAVYGRGR